MFIEGAVESGLKLTLLCENGSHQRLLSRSNKIASIIRETTEQPYIGWNRGRRQRKTRWNTLPCKV